MSRHRRRLRLIAAFLFLVLLVGGLGWTVYSPVRQERLNRALIAAIKKNDTKTALALLAEGADPNARDEPPQHLSLLRLLLDRLRGRQPALSTAPTALLLACRRNVEGSTGTPDNPTLVQALLDRGAAMEVKDPRRWGRWETGSTPLLCATYVDNTEVSKLLIERGANVNAFDIYGGSSLLYAVYYNDKVLVKLLLNRGADVNSSGQGFLSHYPPLLVGDHDDPTITEMLLAKGATINPTERDSWRRVPLTSAIRWDQPRRVRVLIQHGANVNLKTDDGYTPLKMAKSVGDKTILQMLKQAGARE